jgi:glyoxylase-like metal-dependent hydrolase (beta-lactamase superfamily II)
MLYRFRAIAPALLGVLAVANQATAQTQDFSQVEIKTTPLRDNIYMLEGEGGNIGLFVGEDGTFLIDDQFAPLTDKIKAAIAEVTDEPVKFLINTHWHFDHTGGNENLGNEDVVILAHENVRQRLSTGGLIEALSMDIPPAPAAALPVITYDDGVTFHLNGDTIHAIHPKMGGHTDGDTFLHWAKANVIHTGDLFFNGLYPFIDTSSGGSLMGMIMDVNQILAMTNDHTLSIPGHGALASRQDLLNYRNMLMTVHVKTELAITQGQTLEEFIASKPTAEFDDALGKGFLTPEQFQTIVYKDVSAAMNSDHPHHDDDQRGDNNHGEHHPH